MPPTPSNTRTAARLATVLEALYGAIEGQPTGHYRLSASDGWHQARRGQVEVNATEHLETWLDIGAVQFGRAGYAISIEVQTAMRASPDNDSTGSATIHAAALDLMELLTTWGEPTTGARSTPVSYVVEPVDPEGTWQLLRLTLTLYLPRSE